MIHLEAWCKEALSDLELNRLVAQAKRGSISAEEFADQFSVLAGRRYGDILDQTAYVKDYLYVPGRPGGEYQDDLPTITPLWKKKYAKELATWEDYEKRIKAFKGSIHKWAEFVDNGSFGYIWWGHILPIVFPQGQDDLNEDSDEKLANLVGYFSGSTFNVGTFPVFYSRNSDLTNGTEYSRFLKRFLELMGHYLPILEGIEYVRILPEGTHMEDHETLVWRDTVRGQELQISDGEIQETSSLEGSSGSE